MIRNWSYTIVNTTARENVLCSKDSPRTCLQQFPQHALQLLPEHPTLPLPQQTLTPLLHASRLKIVAGASRSIEEEASSKLEGIAETRAEARRTRDVENVKLSFMMLMSGNAEMCLLMVRTCRADVEIGCDLGT